MGAGRKGCEFTEPSVVIAMNKIVLSLEAMLITTA